jgi:trimeric autotransporter adhesin
VLQATVRVAQRDRSTLRGVLPRSGLVACAGARPRTGLRVSRRGLLLAVLAVLAVLGVVAAAALPAHRSRVTLTGALPARSRVLTDVAVGAHRSWAPAGLLSLPAAAESPISAALGRDEAAYQIHGLVAHNPAQLLVARFARSGVEVTAGSKRFAIALEAFGRTNALLALAPSSPVATADRVTYARGPVREWWANGPLGLEQGFDIARRPAGSGALTLSLAVSGGARLDQGTVLLPGGLRYAGLRATDARGRNLRAWLQVHNGRVLVRVNDRGARYPLRIDPFVQQAELDPSDGVGCNGDCGDQFGYSVATSGTTVVVGAPYHAANSQPYSGAVYVFQMPAAGWASATQTAELSDSTLGGDRELGFSVAISSDGHTIVAGAPAGSEAPPQLHVNPCPSTPCTQGTVDVFTTTGGWASTSTPAARLTVAGSESSLGGELGWSVGISGSTVVAGAPYDATYPYTGLAYVFNEPGGGWSGPQTQAAVLTASPLSTTGSGEDQFGWSVGISGNTIVVGAPAYAGASQQDQGAAYVFTGPWSGTQNQTAELLASDPTSNDQLGTSVAVSGNTVVAGADNHQVGSNATQGAAYVFVMPTTGPWVNGTQTAELTASDGQADDELGYSVAISGNTIVAGARQRQVGSNDGQGAAYVYAEPSGGWVTTSASTAELTATDGDTVDNLGDSVAVSGTTIVAGAPRHDAESSTADFGAAYVFGPGSTVPPPVVVTPPPTHPTAKLGSVSSRHEKITVALSCPAGELACAEITLKATVKEHLKGRKITAVTATTKRKARTTSKTVVVASGRTTLSAGTKKTLTLTLNSTGRALLSKFGKLKTVVTVSSGGKTIKTVTVTVLKTAKPKKKKKKK